MNLPKVATKRIWAICPKCGAKVVLFDDTANCSGVWCKCTRKCGTQFELIVVDGKQLSEHPGQNSE